MLANYASLADRFAPRLPFLADAVEKIHDAKSFSLACRSPCFGSCALPVEGMGLATPVRHKAIAERDNRAVFIPAIRLFLMIEAVLAHCAFSTPPTLCGRPGSRTIARFGGHCIARTSCHGCGQPREHFRLAPTATASRGYRCRGDGACAGNSTRADQD